MRKWIAYLVIFIVLSHATASAQAKTKADWHTAVGTAMHKFPGFDTTQMKQLYFARKQNCIALPTWLPDGFKIEKVQVKTGKNVLPEDQGIFIVYSKTLPGGKKQSFIIEGAIDGIGDLLYKPTHIIKSALGDIELCYEPKDEDDNKTLKKYVRTQWYDCNGTAWAYGSNNGANVRLRNTVMISIDETKKILASLQKL